jgi:hypothetical protein
VICLTGKQTSRYELTSSVRSSFSSLKYSKNFKEEDDLTSENDFKAKYTKIEYKDFIYSLKDISVLNPKKIMLSSKNPDYIVFLVPLNE